MTLEEALKAQLVGYAELNALISGRVYPLVLSENATLPAVTYQRISTSALRHRNVASLGRVRFQVDGWTLKYSEAVSLRTHIRAALEGWQRDSLPRVDVALLEDDRDLREPATGRYRASLDFMLLATES
jgi:hypothetical protein